MREREAKTRAKLLEIIGDIPDADMKPPENVLFVCKLNPVTTDDDLELIFSRFGKINSCEVIRDKKTGDSLCYAFIEFDTPEACESAYFKMDNVLIDDRRIHVDFSQSLAKFTWRGKGTGTGYLEDGNNYREDNKHNKHANNNESRTSHGEFKVNSKSRKGEGYDLIIEEDNLRDDKYEMVKHKSHYQHHKKSDYHHSDKKHERKDYHEENYRKDSSKYDKKKDYDDRRIDHSRSRSKSRDRERHSRDHKRNHEKNRKQRSRSRDKYKDNSRDHRKYEEKHHQKHKSKY